MTPNPVRPRTSITEPARKIRELQARLDQWQQLAALIAERICVPMPAVARFETMLVHQREVMQWIKAALSTWPDDPAGSFDFLQAHWPEPPYEVEQ